MSLIRSIFVLVFLFSTIGGAHASDDLKNFLLKFTDPTDYPYHLLDKSYRILYKTGENYVSLDKYQLKELYSEQNKHLTNTVITDFRILGRNDSEAFTSVMYEFNWSARMGNTSMNGKILAHSILLKTKKGWSVVFDVANQ